MTIAIDSQNLESYVPVYDVVPEDPKQLGAFLVEQFKKISEGVNIRIIGFYLDQELLTGGAFIPGTNNVLDGGSSQTFRSILRKVIPFPGLTIGLNTQPHGITVDANFSLIQMYGGATNATALTGEPLPNGADTISYDVTNVYVTVAAAYTRAWVVMEYIQEL